MTAKLPTSTWLDLLGKPYADKGRGPDAFDCVGLLLEIERRIGNALPNYKSDIHELALALAGTWERVNDPQPGDGILIRSACPPWHIGVVCGAGYMIHAHPQCGVSRERYNADPWHKRIEGFYRWKRE
jgi:cell wall-associated NlpC family hydrolase